MRSYNKLRMHEGWYSIAVMERERDTGTPDTHLCTLIVGKGCESKEDVIVVLEDLLEWAKKEK